LAKPEGLKDKSDSMYYLFNKKRKEKFKGNLIEA